MTITLEEALETAKRFIVKMKGLDVMLQGRPLIDYMDFTLLNTRKDTDYHILNVTLIPHPYIHDYAFFSIKVNKETGNVDDFKRLEDDFADIPYRGTQKP